MNHPRVASIAPICHSRDAICSLYDSIHPLYDSIWLPYDAIFPPRDSIFPAYDAISPLYETIGPARDPLQPPRDAISLAYDTICLVVDAFYLVARAIHPGDHGIRPVTRAIRLIARAVLLVIDTNRLIAGVNSLIIPADRSTVAPARLIADADPFVPDASSPPPPAPPTFEDRELQGQAPGSMAARMLRLLLLGIALLSARAIGAPPPNIVLIFVDDMGYADIAPFGGKVPTPNLDRLAREGRKFTNFHVSSAVCSASRAALLTGCYHNRVGIHGALGPGAKIGLNPEETTIAEIAKSRGYATGMSGKWHLGHLPQFLPVKQGFDEWLGLPYSNDMWPHHPEAKAGTYPKLPLFDGDKIIVDDVTPEDQRQLTTRYTERAVAFIERNKAKPFFFYLAHNMPHVPLFVSEKFEGKSGAGLHGDVMQEIDWSVGEVLAALDRAGVADNTWVIFTSDNGPWLSYGEHAGSSGPFREGKGTSWEGGTRVPCLMRWPGKLPAGTEEKTMLMTIDLLPTIAGRLGAELPPRKIDGLDVWPVLAGEPNAKNPHTAYATYYSQNELQSVTDGRWKLVLPHAYRTMGDQPKATGGKPGKYKQERIAHPQLYDLAADPGEQNDLATAKPEFAAGLSLTADTFRSDLGDAITKVPAKGARPPGRQ